MTSTRIFGSQFIDANNYENYLRTTVAFGWLLLFIFFFLSFRALLAIGAPFREINLQNAKLNTLAQIISVFVRLIDGTYLNFELFPRIWRERAIERTTDKKCIAFLESEFSNYGLHRHKSVSTWPIPWSHDMYTENLFAPIGAVLPILSDFPHLVAIGEALAIST